MLAGASSKATANTTVAVQVLALLLRALENPIKWYLQSCRCICLLCCEHGGSDAASCMCMCVGLPLAKAACMYLSRGGAAGAKARTCRCSTIFIWPLVHLWPWCCDSKVCCVVCCTHVVQYSARRYSHSAWYRQWSCTTQPQAVRMECCVSYLLTTACSAQKLNRYPAACCSRTGVAAPKQHCSHTRSACVCLS